MPVDPGSRLTLVGARTTRMDPPGGSARQGDRSRLPDLPPDRTGHLDPQERTRRFVQRQVGETSAGSDIALFGTDGFSFGDIVDMVNPLQHIPVVSTIYRSVTGDEIAPVARIAGGALFGGPIGLAAAVANVAVEGGSGRDLGEHALALFVEEGNEALPAEALAARPEFDPKAGGTVALPSAPEPDQNPDRAPSQRYDVFSGSEQAALVRPVPTSAPGILMDESDGGDEADPAAVPPPTPSALDAAVAPPLVPGRMMEALEKYEAMVRERNATRADGAAAPSVLSIDDRV